MVLMVAVEWFEEAVGLRPQGRASAYPMHATGQEPPRVELQQGDPEPVGEATGVTQQLVAEGGERDPFPVGDLRRVRPRAPVPAAQEDVVVLVLHQPAADVRPIDHAERALDGTAEPELLHQAAPGRILGPLPRTGMAAARVGPEPAGVVLALGPALEEELVPVVQDEHGERPVQAAGPVGRQLPCRPDGPIGGVHQDHALGHADGACASVRSALPAASGRRQRAWSPGPHRTSASRSARCAGSASPCSSRNATSPGSRSPGSSLEASGSSRINAAMSASTSSPRPKKPGR